jgi:beta-glucosidase
VVQLYVRDEVASVSRPVKELKDFQRVKLAAGATAQQSPSA